MNDNLPSQVSSAQSVSCSCRRSATLAILGALRSLVLSVTLGTLLTVDCGNPHAILEVTAPSSVNAGLPFSVTVTAKIGGKQDRIINSYISFTSSDPSAILPARYQFTAADAGAHTWTNSFILKAPGNQTISATIFDATGINGTAAVNVFRLN